MMNAKSSSHDSKTYHQLAHYYELLFARFFRDRIHAAIRALEIPPGARVLEVGVGTGLSLDAYPPHCEVVGIDLSADMLKQAQEKVDGKGWRHIRLECGDAQNLNFPNEHFDYVMAFHVVSVVPDHERMIGEALRVAKSGATIVIINHFRSEKQWLATLTDALDPVTRRLGWRTTLRLADVVQSHPLEIHRVYKSSPRSLFTVVEASKRAVNGSHRNWEGDGHVSPARRSLDPGRAMLYQEESGRSPRHGRSED
jgi:phosphatidylethanolamine/phosphatidyl-N-methylethanolamine N-methyltransferase